MQTSDFIPDTINEFLEVLEKRHEREIQDVKVFLASQQQVQVRELDRLTHKYGSDHPRVRTLEARVARLRHMQDEPPVVEPVTPDEGVGIFAIFQGADAQYYFHLRAANGEIILQSQGYTTLRSAQNGVETVRRNATPDQFEERETEGGEPYFVLKAGNNQVIGKSEVYSSPAAMREGIQSVIENARVAEVEKRES